MWDDARINAVVESEATAWDMYKAALDRFKSRLAEYTPELLRAAEFMSDEDVGLNDPFLSADRVLRRIWKLWKAKVAALELEVGLAQNGWLGGGPCRWWVAELVKSSETLDRWYDDLTNGDVFSLPPVDEIKKYLDSYR